MTLKMKRLTAAILATMASTAYAEEQKHHFDIPAQALGSALQTLASQSGAPMLYAEQTAVGKQSPHLVGDYTTAEAADKLLAGSGLAHSVAANGTVTVKPAPQPQESTTLKPMTVKGKRVGESNDPYNTDYKRTNAGTATKTDTPIMDTPVSIQVVPLQVLKDQQAVTLTDGLKNVSGVQTSPSTVYENFVVRGFDTNASTYRNGIREEAWTAETANVERIEVLKGPAAVMYGRLEPGGMVNRVLKKPSATSYYSLQQQFGSFDLYRTTAEATGALTKDDAVTYRLDFAYQSNNSYRDLVNRDRVFIAPQLNWKISNRTEVGVGMEYQRDNFRWDDGFAVFGNANRPLNLPINTSLSDKLSHDSQERFVGDMHWSHEFNDDWKLSQQFSTFQSTQTQYNIFPADVIGNAPMLDRALWDANYKRDTYSFNTNLLGHFDTAGVKHTVLVGHDYFNRSVNAVTNYGDNWGTDPNNIPQINFKNPNNNITGYPLSYNYPTSYIQGQQEWNGVYFQDQMVFWNKLHLLGGGRYDWTTYGVGSQASAAEALAFSNSHTVSAEKFSPRVGLLYRPWQWLSVYGNYTESLGSTGTWNGLNANDKPFKPEEATQYEAGIKTEFFDKRLTSTIAVFDVTKINMATPDTSSAFNLAHNYMIPIGKARSQGVEFDLSGKITENWSVIGNYALIDARITKANIDNSGNSLLGNRLPNVAMHTANFWTKYDFNQDILKGFSMGTGVRVVGQRQGDVQNDFQLPGYATWDAMASYKIKVGSSYQLTAQLNANNLLDKGYFYGANVSDGGGRLYGSVPGAPRSFMGMIKLEY
jgi:iron complex outermembrane receptor protein